jgi:hypothetical protein
MFDLSEYCNILIYGRPGHGKTQYVKFFLNNIPYKHLNIITSSPYQYEEYNDKRCETNWDYEPEKMEQFLNKKGVKVVVFDDFLHISFTGAIAKSIRGVLSTLRHTNTYVITSCQNLTCIGKTFRNVAKIFITGSIDDDSINLLRLLSGLDKNQIREIKLDKHEFILAQTNGSPLQKIKLKINQIQKNPKPKPKPKRKFTSKSEDSLDSDSETD